MADFLSILIIRHIYHPTLISYSEYSGLTVHIIIRLCCPLTICYDIQFFSDINECDQSNDVCDVHATCNNTVGSYFCKCDDKYTGDGKTCTGKEF